MRYQSASPKSSSLPTFKAMKCDSWQGLVTGYNRHDHVGLSVLIQLYTWLPVDIISLGLWFSWTCWRFGVAYVRVCELKYLSCTLYSFFFLMIWFKSALYYMTAALIIDKTFQTEIAQFCLQLWLAHLVEQLEGGSFHKPARLVLSLPYWWSPISMAPSGADGTDSGQLKCRNCSYQFIICPWHWGLYQFCASLWVTQVLKEKTQASAHLGRILFLVFLCAMENWKLKWNCLM